MLNPPHVLRIVDIAPPEGYDDPEGELPRARVAFARNLSRDVTRPYQRTACQYLLGQLLSSISEDGWALVNSGGGAPRLQLDGRPSPMRISVAHCGRMLAVAVARHSRVGVEIERIRPRQPVAAMARYLGWNGGNNLHAFLARWTMWEACAKISSGKVLANSNPGFEALNGISRLGSLVSTGRWVLFQDLVDDQAFFSVVLNTVQPCPLEQRGLLNAAAPW